MSTQRWYVRRGKQLRGPFPASLIRRYHARGKLADNDELSVDLRSWQTLASLGADPSATAEIAAPAIPAKPPPTFGAARSRLNRPTVAPAPLAPRSAYVQRLLDPSDNRGLQAAAVSLLLGAILFAGVALDDGQSGPGADCAAAPAAGVNWSSCGMDGAQLAGADLAGANLSGARLRGADLKGARMAGADLAYVEFGGSTLAYAQLKGSRLKGATLKDADLSNADLAGADLSYADLSGALLGGARLEDALFDNSIWVDGRVCAIGSVGGCR